MNDSPDEKLKNMNFIINHVFFPPQLPQESDISTSNSFALCKAFTGLAEEFEYYLDAAAQKEWKHVVRMLHCFQKLQEDDDLMMESLEEFQQRLSVGGFLILYIKKQNAGLFVRRMSNGDVSFSAFEVSFPNAQVMATEARLACTFPGPAITVPSSVWLDSFFRSQLVNFLYHMNRDELVEAAAHTKKAKSTVSEIRDVPDPKYISELLMGILHGIGSPTPQKDVRYVNKRIGDDILWKSTYLPWRRSPVYLVLRVGLQLALAYGDHGYDRFKAFMAFAHARLLQKAVQDYSELDTDLLYVMRVKTARRIHKLETRFLGGMNGLGVPPYVLSAAQQASDAVDWVLQCRWEEIQQLQAQSPEWDPESLNLEADTYLRLQHARPRIIRGLQRSEFSPSSSMFNPKPLPRLRYEADFRNLSSRRLEKAFDDDNRAALADFEYLVHTRLGRWTSSNLTCDDATEIVYRSMDTYLAGARRIYSKQNPEDQSHMLLALLALWVSLDKLAVAQLPLLAQYPPEINTTLLEVLLLRQTDELLALRDIVHHISNRKNNAQRKDGIFTDSERSTTFYQQYFDSSSSLQSLKQRIEHRAEEKRSSCRRILKERNELYHSLAKRANSHSHDHKSTYSKKKGRYHEDTSACLKCKLLSQAKKIPKIEVDEWPLPSQPAAAKRVCFELDCPRPFEYWRAATWLLLYDVGISSQNRRSKAGQHGKLPGTYNLPQPSQPLRFTLATTTKSFRNSHYCSRSIPAKEGDVIVNCGSTWKMYEISNECWAADRPFELASFKHMCTPLVSEPYKSLQFSLADTTHTSNKVIAEQANSHADLSLHEFVAFGSLRSGGRLQRMNIARELVTGDLTFRAEPVHTLLLQAAFQVGNWENEEQLILDWHRDLANESFSDKLLDSLENLMLTMSSNWDAVAGLRGVILLICRLMAGSRMSAVEARACQLLRHARQIGLDWMTQLVAKVSSANEDHASKLSLHLCEIAATCRATYSGDPAHLANLLNTSHDISTFMYCAAVVYENTPPNRKGLSDKFCRMLDRNERISINAYDRLSLLIRNDSTGVHQAVKLLWPAYRLGGNWYQLRKPGEHWIQSRTAPSFSGGMQQQLHMDLINGQLLVEGKPVGHLPREITSHPLYTRCLGSRILEVIPSDMPGMEYVTRDLVEGREIHFSTQDPDGLIIRTRQGKDIAELIPHNYFLRDLPSPLVRDYVHWLQISKQAVELSPLDSIWHSPSDKCIIDIIGSPQMTMGPTVHLIDPNSRTMSMLSSQLSSLEYPNEMLVILSDGIVTVDLPRFRSAFQLKNQLLQSKNIPGFCIDSNRSTGTMFGLHNQLVLRPVDSSSLEPRRVLIPHGKIQVQKSSHHVSVEICTDCSTPESMKHAKYHEYLIDMDLGYLQARSLTSCLYKVYLHAVTSGRLPDPLTGRTGTEEALLEYSSASCITFLELESADRELLKSIAELCPKRTFYPKHLKDMQTVDWQSCLPPLSQHSAFHRMTQRIIDYAQKLAIFNQGQTTSPISLASDQSSPALMKKAEYYEGFYHSPDLQDISDLSSRDTSYSLRSIRPAPGVSRTSQEINLSFTKGLLDADATFPEIFALLDDWNPVSPAAEMEIDISYNSSWLAPHFGESFLSVFDALRKQGVMIHYSALFTLVAMAYHSPNFAELIPVFLAFPINPQFKPGILLLPFRSSQCSCYDLRHGFGPEFERLTTLASNAARDLDSASWDAKNLSQGQDEDEWTFVQRVEEDYERQKRLLSQQIAQLYMSQWPSSKVKAPSNRDFVRLFDMNNLQESMQNLFANWFQNRELQRFFSTLQTVLRTTGYQTSTILPPGEITIPAAPTTPIQYLSKRISMKGLLKNFEPPILGERRDDSNSMVVGTLEGRISDIPDTEELGRLLNEFSQSPRPLLRLYGFQLDKSRRALRSQRVPPAHDIQQHNQHQQLCRDSFTDIKECIMNSLQPRTTAEHLLEKAGQWPRLTVRILLHQLCIDSRECYSKNWRHTLTALGCELIYLQRARRMHEFMRNGSPHYSKEVEAIPISLNEAVHNPDWVLMQIESGFTLRPLQHDVLQEMISPASAENTTFQLNMGEGKTSVIAPLAVATLADRKTLVRLIVLKPLSRQMFHLLAARLTGLCDRRLFFLPFSRSANLGSTEINTLRSLLQECLAAGGVLVAQPEHLLSFRLLTVEKLVTGHPAGPILLEIQKWLSQRSRDILDESDEILHSKYQLIYTMGQQQPLEDHPDRWTTVQQVLSLVSRHVDELKCQFPSDVDVEAHNSETGSFPSVRLLKVDPAKYLVARLADDIMEGRLENIHFRFLDPADREVIRTFITQFEVDSNIAAFAKHCFESSGKWGSVLLLRGLLGQGLLTYVLSKRRWRVDYGLDMTRTLLAVPFRAKDVPSPSAEFGHPDIALLLTCLSYYYRGLDKDQLLSAFQLLLNSENVAAEYEAWTTGLDLPPELRRETGINLEDPVLLTDVLVPRFRRTKRVIDFYLSAVVFPKAAKEFPHKLSTSAWDLAEKSKQLKTGFSGTNDNRHLLPTSIYQKDLAGQESTSARVLSYLQQPENGPCITPDDLRVEHVPLETLLSYMASKSVRVLFDVGAQILKVNHDVVRMWLNNDSKAQAAIYFDDKDEITVLTRDGAIEPFVFSSFRDRLGDCVIYLDDAHTRGTDLKFTRGARALVTLGENVTKDRLVQACMRLRQLGHGQSVLFFAPLEIARAIRADAKKNSTDVVQVIDILRWAMLRTCEDIEHHIPHWVQQGVEFHERDAVWSAMEKSGATPDIDKLRSAWQRPEARTLEQLYLPPSASAFASSTGSKVRLIPDMQTRLDLLGITNIGDASVDEEQEREVAQEIEQERQLERPPPATPLPHSIHQDVARLIDTGILKTTSNAFRPLFNTVPSAVRTQLQESIYPWSTQLWATRDFAVAISQNETSKEHMRPVNWLLSCRASKMSVMNIVVLSPYEVQELLPAIRKSTKVNLHVYAPRVRREMSTFEDLKFICIPPLKPNWNGPDTLVISQLNLFSGQLYFANFDVYRNLCAFLGVGTYLEDMESPVINSDGFVRPEARGPNMGQIEAFYSGCPFVSSPIPFLKELTSLRRKSNKYLSTQWGKVVHGRVLLKDEFEQRG
ncbi:hypothetical protein GYMLUDRAFT_70721 [Collybiopsis luxurians FD-317 M1]|nr:hypothetical protein GYMLUDRAFT_70721 [Collybiopsis luxurians FD-317 M1]